MASLDVVVAVLEGEGMVLAVAAGAIRYIIVLYSHCEGTQKRQTTTQTAAVFTMTLSNSNLLSL